MRRGIYLAFGVCLVLVTSSEAAPTQPEPATEEEMDRQIGDMLQKLEKAKNLNPREKRAVNVLSGLLGGGGGGGSLLNELNKGPTYSQLLGSGGGFNKAGLLSGFLGSSSGTAIINRRPLVSVSLGGGAGIIDEDPEAVALRFSLEQQKENSPVDLGGPQGGLSAHIAIPLRSPLGLLFSPTTSSLGDYDDVEEDDVDSDADDDNDGDGDVSYEDDVNVDVNVRANLPSDGDSDMAVTTCYPQQGTETSSYRGPCPQETAHPKPSGGSYPPESPDPKPFRSYGGPNQQGGSNSYGTPNQQGGSGTPYPREAQDPKASGNRYPEEAPDPAPPRQLTDHRRDPIASRRPRKQRGGRGGRGQKNGNGGASASASADLGGADASAGAAGGGSDSGSVLSLVTPLLGSSSAGAAGGGADGGAGVGVSLGGGGGGGANATDIWRETVALHYRIKSFIFRKLAQLLGSSSGSPQAG